MGTEATRDYYNRNAEAFRQRTGTMDVATKAARFLALLPAPARILDAGCGPGRDSRHFLQLGHTVTAIDASEAMVEMATRATGQPALLLPFERMEFTAEFDGIWANASLLHVPRTDIDGIMERLIRALKPGGILYLSVKQGVGARIDETGRFFCDYTESTLQELFVRHPELCLIEILPAPANESSLDGKAWLRALARKVLAPARA